MERLDEKHHIATEQNLTDEDRKALQYLDEKLKEADLLAEHRGPMDRDPVQAYAKPQHKRGRDQVVRPPEVHRGLRECTRPVLWNQQPEGEAKRSISPSLKSERGMATILAALALRPCRRSPAAPAHLLGASHSRNTRCGLTNCLTCSAAIDRID
jgi:hypothetical protein